MRKKEDMQETIKHEKFGGAPDKEVSSLMRKLIKNGLNITSTILQNNLLNNNILESVKKLELDPNRSEVLKEVLIKQITYLEEIHKHLSVTSTKLKELMTGLQENEAESTPSENNAVGERIEFGYNDIASELGLEGVPAAELEEWVKEQTVMLESMTESRKLSARLNTSNREGEQEENNNEKQITAKNSDTGIYLKNLNKLQSPSIGKNIDRLKKEPNKWVNPEQNTSGLKKSPSMTNLGAIPLFDEEKANAELKKILGLGNISAAEWQELVNEQELALKLSREASLMSSTAILSTQEEKKETEEKKLSETVAENVLLQNAIEGDENVVEEALSQFGKSSGQQ